MNPHKNPWDYPFQPLRDSELERAAQMWADSKNTVEIARALMVSEARVFNSMGAWMPRARALAAFRRAQRDGKTPSTLANVGGRAS
jgi:hypothetical protein